MKRKMENLCLCSLVSPAKIPGRRPGVTTFQKEKKVRISEWRREEEEEEKEEKVEEEEKEEEEEEFEFEFECIVQLSRIT